MQWLTELKKSPWATVGKAIQMIVSVAAQAQVSVMLPGSQAAQQVAPVAGTALRSASVSQTGNWLFFWNSVAPFNVSGSTGTTENSSGEK